MQLPPVPDPLPVFVVAEVMGVGGLAQPTLLAGPLAGPLTGRLGAILLPVAVAEVGKKKLPAIQAFAVAFGQLHGDQKPPRLTVSPAAAKFEPNDTGRKRTKQTEEDFSR